ncbi:uncharacterized protein LOC116169107 [Photinus pyralis]|uniref:uncharacterized protein LOC116169107 n=1 Tax=Photinus pyralis TaxID=7054 RepID=UPI0012674B99|nr:uncharacterized protein LOC116169107 [Photinus pyralis]
MSWRKEHIMNWLMEKEVPIEDNMLKRDLLAAVAEVKPRYDKHKLDVTAQERGHEILRLPPYHCELHPIEMVKNMQELIKLGYEKVTIENWQHYINHVKGIENNMWIADNLQDDIQAFVINVTESSSDDDPEYESSDN